MDSFPRHRLPPDLSKKLVSEAQSKYPEASFEVRDILNGGDFGKYDFVLCSGALNFKISDNENYIKKCCIA